MLPAQTKIVLVSVAIVGSIVLLGLDGSRSATVYYQTLPEFRTSLAGPQGSPASGPRAAPAQGRPVRLTGYVVDGSIRQVAGAPLRFVMRDAARTTTLEVAYDDLVPDTFKDGAEVVVEGQLGAGDAFEATLLLAKCPSKYENADGAGKAGSY